MSRPRLETRGDLAREQVRRRGGLYFRDVDEQVQQRLRRLPPDHRRAFALVCGERAMAWHLSLPDDRRRPFTLGWVPVLATIRAGLLGHDREAPSRVKAAMDEFHASPYDHSEGQEGPDDADEDAAAAAIYAASCYLDAGVEPAAWAASRVVDIGFEMADADLRLDPNEFEWDPDADPPSPLAQENLHPVVQTELRRQLDDLEELSSTAEVRPFLGRRAAGPTPAGASAQP